MSPAFSRTPRCGRRAWRRCLPKPGRAAAGRPTLLRRDGEHQPVSVKDARLGLPAKAWRTITWREGSAERLASRFAGCACAPPHRDYKLTTTASREWLLIEWPKGEAEPTKYWLSTLPEDIAFARLVDLAKLRWRIERDYQELKQELGLGHYEGRGWRGFHHHATLCIAAYGFLISERETIPPSGPRAAPLFQTPAVPRVTDPEAPPIRPERHIPNSIATMRRRLTVALAKRLSAMSVLYTDDQAHPRSRNL